MAYRATCFVFVSPNDTRAGLGRGVQGHHIQVDPHGTTLFLQHDTRPASEMSDNACTSTFVA